MDKQQILIENIKQSNLSDKDKEILIIKALDADFDYSDFVTAFLVICKLSPHLFSLFGLDIGNT